MSYIVQKFGGTSVASVEKICAAAKLVLAAKDQGMTPIVVVSAMAGVTDQLVGYVRSIKPYPRGREYDTVVSSGEQVVAGLMALALQKMGLKARSLLAWQIPIRTNAAPSNARIIDIDSGRLRHFLDLGEIIVVPGFQGIFERDITTLGRGGSDTTAVALAAVLGPCLCDIFTDVDGIYTADPRIVPDARKLTAISYDEMLEMASLGAKVLQTRSVQLAAKYQVRLRVRSTFTGSEGTLITSEDNIVEKPVVSGIAHALSEAKITLRKVEDRPGVAAKIFALLASKHINVDMIVQNISEDGQSTDITFTVHEDQLAQAETVLNSQQKIIGFESLVANKNVAKISIVGFGMRSHSGVAVTMFKALHDLDVNIQVISTSEIRVSILIDAHHCQTVVQELHRVFDLA